MQERVILNFWTLSARACMLEAVGRVMCKALLCDQPLGHGCGRLIFEYLADPSASRISNSVHFALAMLDDFDPGMAEARRNLSQNQRLEASPGSTEMCWIMAENCLIQ